MCSDPKYVGHPFHPVNLPFDAKEWARRPCQFRKNILFHTDPLVPCGTFCFSDLWSWLGYKHDLTFSPATGYPPNPQHRAKQEDYDDKMEEILYQVSQLEPISPASPA